jgi:activating signal cointegrator complex subunit 3
MVDTYPQVGLMVIDEIHLLGADRGPILEVIVSRMRYIASNTGRPVRFVGLSTALANAQVRAHGIGKACHLGRLDYMTEPDG